MWNPLDRTGTAVGNLSEGVWKDGEGWILVFVSLGWFLVLGGRIVYPALLPLVSREFAVNYTTVGGLIGVLWVAYAVVQFPGGFLADRFGERAVLVTSLSLSLFGMAAVVLSPVFGAFVVATAVLGVGNGLFGTTRITVLSDIYDEVETTAISICQAAGNVGNSLLPIVASAVATALGWRLGFGFLLPLFALAAVGTWYTLPERTSAAADWGGQFRSKLRNVIGSIRGRSVLQVTSVHFMTILLYQSLTGFFPTYLVEAKSLSTDTAALLFGLFFAAAIGIQFLSGLIADRYGRRFTMAGFLGLSVPGYWLLPSVEGFLGLAGVTLLLSCMLGAFPPAHSYAVRALPSALQGSGYGLIRTLYITFGAVGPPLVGIMADVGLFTEAFLLLGAVGLLASLDCVLLPPLK